MQQQNKQENNKDIIKVKIQIKQTKRHVTKNKKKAMNEEVIIQPSVQWRTAIQ